AGNVVADSLCKFLVGQIQSNWASTGPLVLLPLGCIQAENLAAPFAALLNNGQEPRVACLPFGDFLDLFRLALAGLAGAGDLHNLGIPARALPCRPGLPLDLVVLGERVGLG